MYGAHPSAAVEQIQRAVRKSVEMEKAKRLAAAAAMPVSLIRSRAKGMCEPYISIRRKPLVPKFKIEGEEE